jgi:DNA-binding CsgD family transcriptional regulator
VQPRDRLTSKEIRVATLVWQGLTNKDIARVLLTSEQVVKNYLRTAFDKLGAWTRLELALYVASQGLDCCHRRQGGVWLWVRKGLVRGRGKKIVCNGLGRDSLEKRTRPNCARGLKNPWWGGIVAGCSVAERVIARRLRLAMNPLGGAGCVLRLGALTYRRPSGTAW